MKYYDMEYDVQWMDVRASNLEHTAEPNIKATAIVTWYDADACEWYQESIGHVTEPEEALKLIAEITLCDDPAVIYGPYNMGAEEIRGVVVTMIQIRR